MAFGEATPALVGGRSTPYAGDGTTAPGHSVPHRWEEIK